nr:immunoglobulin light chain junction region [Macaca mulatta]MOX07159.1 immunoglobulin light chain junction region [Macaca mulatta]MOX10110.1 immunoglobulin light chain junction region [Macaca mulatta]MOX10287.1 immunoglobulin light chain junction region [Macaca mulatta]MOX24141.1 immunoglobulin light chain junction region [Macaca mulatta]
CQHNYGTPLTF